MAVAMLLVAGLGGCFLGEFLAGRPCASDLDCGPRLNCEGGYCGGVLPSEAQLCLDGDGDGFGDPASCEVRILADLVGEDWVALELATDCDDADARTYPGAAGIEDPLACMRDGDGDGWGAPVPGPGIVAGIDCNDEDPGTFPRAAFNEALFDACMTDADGDGWGAPETNAAAGMGAGMDGGLGTGTDCDDGDARTFPGAAYNELLDTDSACRRDRDADGFGAAWPGAGIFAGSDCDDDDANIVDLSCDVSCPDVDGDGQGAQQGCSPVEPGRGPLMEQVLGFEDCDDFSATTFRGAAQFEGAQRCMRDADDDGWGEAEPLPGVEAGRDCDDQDLGELCLDYGQACYEAQLPGQDVLVELLGNGGVVAAQAPAYEYGYAWDGAEPDLSLSIGTPAAYYASAVETRAYAASVVFGDASDATDFLTVHVRDQPFARRGDSCELVALIEGEGDQAPALIELDADARINCASVDQDVGVPTAHVCMPVARSRLVGHLRASQRSAASTIGMVWGYEDARHFYLLQWGNSEQDAQDCPALSGIHLKRFAAQSPLTRADFCSSSDRDNVTVLLGGPLGQSYEPWRLDTDYRVEIEHRRTSSRVRVCAEGPEGCQIVIDQVIVDASFPRGRFGIYLDGDSGLCGGPWTSSCLEQD